MNNIKEITNRYAIIPHRYTIKKNATIIDSDDGHFVFKKRNGNNDNEQLFKYLRSRSFPYIPNLISKDDEYDVYEYVDDVESPREQKALDTMYLIAMLHNKTTFYKDVDVDETKEIYENTIKQLDYIYNYYTDVITMIEKDVYMSPSDYLIAINISKIFESIMYARREIDRWYEEVKDKHKKRVVTLHNNLDLDHIIRNDDLYLLSWDNTKQDMPFYDFLNFYKKYALEFDFHELLNYYESKYKLLDEERLLMFVLMAIPGKIEYKNNEIERCVEARKILDYIYKTELVLAPYYTEDNPKQGT